MNINACFLLNSNACIDLRCIKIVLFQVQFVNRYWGNPLRHEGADGKWVIDPDTPEELQDLSYSDQTHVCHVAAHVGFERSDTSTFPHVNGSIVMFRPKRSLTRRGGVSSFVLNHSLAQPSADRIATAWNWLVQHNHLYENLDLLPIPLTTADLPEDPTIQEGHRPNAVALPTGVFGGLDRDPGAADLDTDTGTDKAVDFENPDLLPMMFPHLYPYGYNAFALWHNRKKLRSADLDNLPVMTNKAYTKFRISHFDRRWARDSRFIAVMADWDIKNSTYGYRLRTTAAACQGTTRGDILQCMD